jgi:GNAT superfamily N-acetyltransferase
MKQPLKINPATPEAEIEIIIPTRADSERLLELARKIDLFLPGDVDIINELWTEFVAKDDSHYHFIVAKLKDDFLGFACYGQRPLTQGTFDLYWIGVDQRQQGHGVGKALIRSVEERVRERSGRLLIAETEGQPSFESSRRFYLSTGYELEARIRDFYKPGEDLVIFTKPL